MKSRKPGENKYRRKVVHPDMRLTVVLPRTAAQDTLPPEFTAFKEQQGFERKNISERRIIPRGSYELAYIGVFAFIFLLYLRPNDLLPIGKFPIIKIITVLVVAAYVFSKASTGEKTVITVEAKLMLFIIGLAIVLAPIAASPSDTINVLNETYSKIVIIFILLTNLLDTRERILKIWLMVAGFGAWLSFLGMRSYFRGEFGTNERIVNSVGGMFGNPNDLAASIDIILPIAVVMAIMSSRMRRLFYFGCIAVMALGLVITQSRGGFIGFIATVSFLTWKLAKGHRLRVFTLVIVLSGSALVALPSSYSSKYIGRIGSIFNFEADETGAAQERRALFYHNLNNFLRRPITGVGMGNLHIYSLKELGAHNAYLETAAELGIFGFIAYIAFMVCAYRGLDQIEKRIRLLSPKKEDKQLFYMCVGLKAAFISYFICSVFASIQYQWFIYLPAAYAVALRRIDEAESEERGETDKKATAYGTILKVTTRLNAAIFDKGRKPAYLFSLKKQSKGKLMK